MFSDSVIDPLTIQVYQETYFHVRGATPTTLLIDSPNATLRGLHKSARVNCSAFITACNPHSQACDAATNLQRHELLAAELRARSLNFIEGIGLHPSGDWPGEESFLVFGLSLEAARNLGMRHQQNAVVWCGADAVPELILLR